MVTKKKYIEQWKEHFASGYSIAFDAMSFLPDEYETVMQCIRTLQNSVDKIADVLEKKGHFTK